VHARAPVNEDLQTQPELALSAARD
jgi:hypothetical protein